MSGRVNRGWAIGGGCLAAALTAVAIGVPATETGAPPKCFGKPATIVAGNGDSKINDVNSGGDGAADECPSDAGDDVTGCEI
jgi:hypothetical protein